MNNPACSTTDVPGRYETNHSMVALYYYGYKTNRTMSCKHDGIRTVLGVFQLRSPLIVSRKRWGQNKRCHPHRGARSHVKPPVMPAMPVFPLGRGRGLVCLFVCLYIRIATPGFCVVFSLIIWNIYVNFEQKLNTILSVPGIHLALGNTPYEQRLPPEPNLLRLCSLS